MKKILAIMLTFVLCFGVLSFAFAAENETTVPDGYTGIYTAEDLDNIRDNLSGKYILMNDIDLSVYENWNPIGTSEAPFTGELNGNGHAVKNMTITVNQQAAFNAGLFGYIKNATIKNLTIDNGKIDVTADEGINAGLVCAECVDSGFISCTVSGEIKTDSKSTLDAGGIIGCSFGRYNNKGLSVIENCSNSAEITASVVYETGDVYYCDIHLGGIAGFTEGKVSRCCNFGDIYSTLSKTSDVSLSNMTGGICGYTDGAIFDCYNIGNINTVGGESAYVGGIAGYWMMVNEISNVYNIGKLTASSDDESLCHAILGHSLGPVYPDEGSYELPALKNAYYLDNMEAAYGWQLPNLENVKVLTTEEFKNTDSFIGFDFENIWVMDEELGRPVFKTEQEEPVTESTTKEAETTQSTTGESTEPTTDTTTEPVTSQEGNFNIFNWLMKVIKSVVNYFVQIFVHLGC